MGIAAYILIAVMAISCALLVIVTRWFETQYYRRHPPDDGCRVEKFGEDDPDE